MTAIGILSIVLSLLALVAFCVGGLILTISLWREMELPQADRSRPEPRGTPLCPQPCMVRSDTRPSGGPSSAEWVETRRG